MYLDFFGLRELPFGVTPDPAFLYLSQTHREALEALRSDLVTDRGFMALVGEPGLGKTTLLMNCWTSGAKRREWFFCSRRSATPASFSAIFSPSWELTRSPWGSWRCITN